VEGNSRGLFNVLFKQLLETLKKTTVYCVGLSVYRTVFERGTSNMQRQELSPEYFSSAFFTGEKKLCVIAWFMSCKFCNYAVRFSLDYEAEFCVLAQMVVRSSSERNCLYPPPITHIHYYYTPPPVLTKMRNVSDKSCRENQNTHFMLSNFFFSEIVPFYEIMSKVTVEPERPQMTTRLIRLTF
jgi:hypothetical protein